MARAIEIPFVADVRDWLRGTRKVVDETDDIADALDDATRDAKRFEDRFSGAMRDAERQADRSGRRIEDDLGDTMRDVGDEARQNLSEGFSSGFRDAEDAADAFQSTLGGLVSGLSGPVGIAAGIVAAGAATIFSNVFTEWQATQDRISESTEALFTAMRESIAETGRAITEEIIQANLETYLAENAEHLQEMEAAAKALGVDYGTYVRALAGDVAAQREIRDEYGEQLNRLDNINDRWGDIEPAARGALGVSKEQVEAADLLLDRLEEQEVALRRATGQADAYARALRAGTSAGGPTLPKNDRAAYGNIPR